MVAPAAGSVVLIRFPFSDLSQTKLRPAVVLAQVARRDRILCQITSKAYGDPDAIEISDTGFVSGSLRVTSYARPGKLFTASEELITAEVAVLNRRVLSRIVDALVEILRSGAAPSILRLEV